MLEGGTVAFARTTRHHDSVLATVILFGVALLAIELGLQWRAHLNWGQSIFDVAAQGETRYVKDARTGLTMLRPNLIATSKNQVVLANSLGLRSPEPLTPRPPGGLRIAIVGASSVFGAYAADNESTFSQILARRLQMARPGQSVEVINGGQVGLSLRDQLTMLTEVILPLKPDWVVLYSGTNDFVQYCRKDKKNGPGRQPLWQPNPAARLLTSELASKNSVGVRKLFAPLERDIDVERVDLAANEETLRRFVEQVKAAGARVLLATNARSFRPEQPLELQRELAGSALYYNHCFSLAGLHRMHERVNGLIEQVAARSGAQIVLLDRLVPGGGRHFADASHFSPDGERLVADILYARLQAESSSESAGTGDAPRPAP